MKLPSAPLAEVVFELRWSVVRDAFGFGYDPAYAVFGPQFATAAAEAGFPLQELISQPGPTVPHQISHRYRKEREAFPLLQCGHGIVACNMSTGYEWVKFVELISHAVSALRVAYPVTAVSPLTPCHIELRYVDVFAAPVMASSSLPEFLSTHTTLPFGMPPFLKGGDFLHNVVEGQVSLSLSCADPTLGKFGLNVASGSANERPGLIMTSRVVNDGDLGVLGECDATAVLTWAERAHKVTSKFFKDFMTQDAMKLFHQNPSEAP